MLRAISLILICSLLFSCEKECTGNCAEITIIGKVVNATNKQGIANVPIQINWQESGFGFFNFSLKFANTKTDNQGQFKISKEIDKAKFKTYYLQVDADIPEGFIDYYGQNKKKADYINQYQPVTDIRLEIYPEAPLTIKLVRNQNDNLKFLSLNYSYHRPYGAGVFISTNSTNDTTFNVKTAANVYTKIEWSKNYGPGQTSTFVDSILCSPSKTNVFTINY